MNINHTADLVTSPEDLATCTWAPGARAHYAACLALAEDMAALGDDYAGALRAILEAEVLS